jgi:hypothetical protein
LTTLNLRAWRRYAREEDTGIGYIVMRNMAADLSFKLRHRQYLI